MTCLVTNDKVMCDISGFQLSRVESETEQFRQTIFSSATEVWVADVATGTTPAGFKHWQHRKYTVLQHETWKQNKKVGAPNFAYRSAPLSVFGINLTLSFLGYTLIRQTADLSEMSVNIFSNKRCHYSQELLAVIFRFPRVCCPLSQNFLVKNFHISLINDHFNFPTHDNWMVNSILSH